MAWVSPPNTLSLHHGDIDLAFSADATTRSTPDAAQQTQGPQARPPRAGVGALVGTRQRGPVHVGRVEGAESTATKMRAMSKRCRAENHGAPWRIVQDAIRAGETGAAASKAIYARCVVRDNKRTEVHNEGHGLTRGPAELG